MAKVYARRIPVRDVHEIERMLMQARQSADSVVTPLRAR